MAVFVENRGKVFVKSTEKFLQVVVIFSTIKTISLLFVEKVIEDGAGYF